jgi:hypothetical protein
MILLMNRCHRFVVLLVYLEVLLDNTGLSLDFPFCAVCSGVLIQVFVTCNSKHSTVLEFLCKWNDVKGIETKLSSLIVPSLGRILLCASSQVSLAVLQLMKESFVPLDVHSMPMVHGM